jgi:hypothetical protein
MSWNITLEVVDCDAMATVLEGAKVMLGNAELGFTDSTGLFQATLDDFNNSPIFKISKDDYIAGNFSFNKEVHSGTTQTVCLRNPPTIPDGHDPNIPGESGGQEFGGGGCFIVTAATGSPESVEATRLRELRDRVGAASRLAAQLIDLVYGEYKEFSPGIAAELRRDGIVREAVLRMVVRPLFAWYTLAGTLAFEGADRKAVGRAAREVSNACPKYLGGTIIPFLEAIRAKEELPANTPRVLLDLAPRVAHLRFASWAILDPLVRAWRSATDRLDVVDEVGRWLADAPLEALSPSDDTGLLDRELGVLARFLDFRPTARARLGERLRTAWPHAAVALEQAGFVRQSPN